MFFGFPWDALGSIRDFWWLKFSYVSGIPYSRHIYNGYPFGVDMAGSPFPYIHNGLGFLLTSLAGEVAAYNLIKLASFPLLALSAYFLFYYLTKHQLVSAVFGLAYAFSPFHVIHMMAHFTNLYWLPLVILFFLKMLDEGGMRNAILFGLSFGACFVDNAYYGYFFGLLIPVFVIIKVAGKNTVLDYERMKLSLVSLFIFMIVVLPLLYPVMKNVIANEGWTGFEGYSKSFADLFIFSAKPLDYIMPSRHNPFLGWLSPDMGLGALKGHRYTEHTLYIGWSVLALAGFALFRFFKKNGKGTEQDRNTVWMFFFIALCAVILSAPPFIPLSGFSIDSSTREITAQHKISLPQYFLYGILPVFRVYARIGSIVLLAAFVLAAFGLRELLSKSTERLRPLILVAVSLVLFVEFFEFPQFRLTKTDVPEVYKFLAASSESFPIIEYPLGDRNDPYTTYEYNFYQRIHGKYLVNGGAKGTAADAFRIKIADISKPEAIAELDKIGIRYIVLHKDKYVKGAEIVRLDWLTTPPRNKLFPPEYNDGRVPDLSAIKDRITKVKNFGDTEVYEIK